MCKQLQAIHGGGVFVFEMHLLYCVSSSYLFLPVRFRNRISFTPDSDEINQPRVIVNDTKETIRLKLPPIVEEIRIKETCRQPKEACKKRQNRE